MHGRLWKLAAALALVASAIGCKKDDGHTPTPVTPAGPTLSVTASDPSLIANGTNTVTITATDTGGSGPINLTTTRGTFSGGGTTAQIAGATGTVTLVTCDASSVSSCAGTARVTATGPSGTDAVDVLFGSLAAVCPTNCAADAGCAGSSCTITNGGTGTCSATTPSICTPGPSCTPNPAGSTTETSCTDGLDNDCNGDVDCADDGCAGQTCGLYSICRSGACVNLAAGLAITIVPQRTRLPADGVTATTIEVTLTSQDQPVPNLEVSFEVSPAATPAFGTLSATTGTSDLNGKVFVTYTAPATNGVAVITARVTTIPTVFASASITMPRLGSLQIPEPSALHPILGVKTSGWNEFTPVMVQVLDDQGTPYPDGLAVRFEHRSLAGSTFGAPLAPEGGTCLRAADCYRYDGAVSSEGSDEPDSTGLASAPLFSGTSAGTLVVTATTTASGVTKTVTLPSVAVVGAKANGANFSVMCGPRNVPALAEHDCSVSWVDAPFTCVAIAKDRFNNLLGTKTQVLFASEAAAVGQVAWTPPYDPLVPGAAQETLGTATQIFQTLGAGLPFDVDPLDDGATPPTYLEPFVTHALDGCGPRTHNPRDGVVTILAVADGEEGFFDANGNGVYDAAVGATPGEPFIDQGEPFLDQDDDGAHDAGEWFLDVDGNGAYTPPNGRWDAQTKIWTQTIVLYTGAPAPELALGTTPETYRGTRWVDDVTPYAGACTPTPAPALFSVDSGPTPSSVTYTVAASDRNLNVLTKGTTYGAKAVGKVKLAVEYLGLESYADLLGMSYRYWPCDQPAVGAPSCASQCRTPVGTGAAGPCVMTPSVSAFWCGIDGDVRMTGGPEADGDVSVQFTVDTPWASYGGEGKVELHRSTVDGVSDDDPTTP